MSAILKDMSRSVFKKGYISVKIDILEKNIEKVLILMWEKAIDHENVHTCYNISSDVQHDSVITFERIKQLACMGHSP